MAETFRITVLDALDNALGGNPQDGALERLTLNELDNIGGLLTKFWDAQRDAEDSHDRGDRASFIGGWMSSFWSEQVLRQDLSDALLYYPKLVTLDPLADFFSHGEGLPKPWSVRYIRTDRQVNTTSSGPTMWRRQGCFDTLRSEPATAAAHFARIVRNLYSLEKPIRAGIITVRSQWPTIKAAEHALETAVRHNTRSLEVQEFLRSAKTNDLHVWDNLAGGQLTTNLPVVRQDAPWQYAPPLYYLAKTLAVASAADAQYVPLNETSLGLLRTVYNQSVRAHPSAMLREVARLAVPTAEIPLNEAVALRASSEDFEDWRLALQGLHRDTLGADPHALKERVEEALVPRIHEVERGLRRSSIGESFRRAGSDFVVDGAIGVATSIAASQTGNIGIGLASAAGGGLLRWLFRQYAPQPTSGAQAILATLIRGSRRGLLHE